ncbi:nucleoside phosphorylase domain-containing protein [Aspergillus parasiticus]|uniref:Nucleoside phosphorylase domain-containing protein n=1 Tax=Aspergillus parasiticus TaxID=5067 RepID=A0A5N6E460_ASPPA|nr:nucleoside phosphorylase domain-containing protein [Aspergillus parasiticus]
MGKRFLNVNSAVETRNDTRRKNAIPSTGPGIGSSPHGNEEYTIGWVSALPIEMAAAKGMLDEEHGDPQTPPQEADQNTYLLGAMSGFKVVIACLPKDEVGASSAAVVATGMLFTFPNIRVGIMVGIGAGIPHYDDDDETRDIRLGDVVIGSDRGSSGVIVYDFGKRLPNGSFENIYALDRPPRTLRTALAKMEAEHQTRENKICQYINSMLDKYPYMRKKGFAYPGSSYDQLFEETYRHAGGRSCAACDPTQQIHREGRFDTSPEIHYGIVATGSAVVKHAPTRAQIKQRHGAICLEMEAAGLINNFPCIVIRGISDYADSHKNDQWHSYAAAAAAACAKELLEFVQPTALDAERKAKDVLQILNKGKSRRFNIILLFPSLHTNNNESV